MCIENLQDKKTYVQEKHNHYIRILKSIRIFFACCFFSDLKYHRRWISHLWLLHLWISLPFYWCMDIFGWYLFDLKKTGLEIDPKTASPIRTRKRFGHSLFLPHTSSSYESKTYKCQIALYPTIFHKPKGTIHTCSRYPGKTYKYAVTVFITST